MADAEEAAAVAEAIKVFALALVFSQTLVAEALDQRQVAALQDYMTEASGGGKGGHPLREAQQKLDAIEKRLLQLIFVFKRIGPLVDSRSQELESLNAAIGAGQLDLNPYEETSWLKGKGAETVLFCCYIRNDQRIAQTVQENVARGLAPLTAQMMDRLTARIQAVSRSGGTMVVEDDDDDTPPQLKSTGGFKPSGKSSGPSTAAQKMLDNIGYSEKPATPPTQPPPAPAAPPAAPAAASPAATAPSAPVPPAAGAVPPPAPAP